MNPSHADFVTNYAKLSEPELMQVARSYDTLTSTAQAALREEFARRRLEPPLVEEVEEPPSERMLVTVGRYRDLTEANLAQALLESAEIPAYLWNENLVRLDWPVSNAIGGVQLQVERQDGQSAMELLKQSAPESISFANDQEFIQPRCPTCGSNDVALGQYFGVAVTIPPGSDVWRCNACGECWEQTED